MKRALELREIRRRGRRSEGRLRDRRAPASRDALNVNDDARLGSRRRKEAYFNRRSERARPMTDETVQRVCFSSARICSQPVCRGIVRDEDRSAIRVVAIHRVRRVQRSSQRGERRQQRGGNDANLGAEPGHARRNRGRTAAIPISARPKVQTMVAPVGRSN